MTGLRHASCIAVLSLATGIGTSEAATCVEESTFAPGVTLCIINDPVDAYVIQVDRLNSPFEFRVLADETDATLSTSTGKFTASTVLDLASSSLQPTILAINGTTFLPGRGFSPEESWPNVTLVTGHNPRSTTSSDETILHFDETVDLGHGKGRIDLTIGRGPVEEDLLRSYYYAVGSTSPGVAYGAAKPGQIFRDDGSCDAASWKKGDTRTAIGYTATTVVLVSIKQQAGLGPVVEDTFVHSADVQELCKIFGDFGVATAINLDGGTSTTLVIGDTVVNPLVGIRSWMLSLAGGDGKQRYVANAIGLVTVREYECFDGADDDGDGEVDCTDVDCREECGWQCETVDDCPSSICETARCVDNTCEYTPNICADGFACDVVSGCGSEKDCLDLDNDGYSGAACGGADCVDSESNIHPGATDDTCDGLDADCSGDDATCSYAGGSVLPVTSAVAPLDVCPGDRFLVDIGLTNDGTTIWDDDGTGVLNPKYLELRSVDSAGTPADGFLYYRSTWINRQRVAKLATTPVNPGGNGDFSLIGEVPIDAPAGAAEQYFQPYHALAEYLGSPTDLAVYLEVADCGSLSAPTGVTAYYDDSTGANWILWDAVSGADSYSIYWGTDLTVSKVNKAGILAEDETETAHNGVVPGYEYFYRVAGVEDGVEGNLSAAVSVFVPDTCSTVTAPTRPAYQTVGQDLGISDLPLGCAPELF